MACREWLRDGDDRAAECETPGVVPEAPARGEGGWTGAVEVRLTLGTTVATASRAEHGPGRRFYFREATQRGFVMGKLESYLVGLTVHKTAFVTTHKAPPRYLSHHKCVEYAFCTVERCASYIFGWPSAFGYGEIAVVRSTASVVLSAVG